MGKRRFFHFILEKLILGCITFYQVGISPYLKSSCRYIPSCSCYAKECIKNNGIFYGLILTFKRLIKCNPWGGFGFDFPPHLNKKRSTDE